MKDDEKKVEFAEALGKVLSVAEEEGYSSGWDFGFDLGRSSGSRDAAYDFVEHLCTAYDKYVAKTYNVEEDGKAQNEEHDRTIGLFLEILENELPFEINWTDKQPVFNDEDDGENGD